MILRTAAFGATRFTTFINGLIGVANAETLTAFAATLLLATVAAAAALAAAAVALAVVWAAAVIAFALGAAGAWAASSSSLVRTTVVLELLEELLPDPELEPFELTEPDKTIAPPVTLIDPVEPPELLNAPLTVTA